LRNRKVLSLEWKYDGVMADNSGDDDTDEVRLSRRRDESGRGRSRRHRNNCITERLAHTCNAQFYTIIEYNKKLS